MGPKSNDWGWYIVGFVKTQAYMDERIGFN
ncbi:uncharacterized protein G2W53_008810 [Senna tora]|uniref:Uncharacterized protein n=1 Tax=Senna tora TaxID=362788 RepID=A0A835C6V7_9FABA|nr:uncharacterized protein G2W53_008810 [Senna tora]